VVSHMLHYWDPCTYGYPTSTHSPLPFAAQQLISLPNYFQCTYHYGTVIPESGWKDNEIKHRDNCTFTCVLADYRKIKHRDNFHFSSVLAEYRRNYTWQLYFYFCDNKLQKKLNMGTTLLLSVC